MNEAEREMGKPSWEVNLEEEKKEALPPGQSGCSLLASSSPHCSQACSLLPPLCFLSNPVFTVYQVSL